MGKDIKDSLRNRLEARQEAASEWVKKTKEDMEVKNWLRQAQQCEAKKDYSCALDAYLSFIELKLNLMKSRPEYTVKDFLALVVYYAKIGDCYKNTRHYKRDDRLIDFQKASKYYLKAAGMYVQLEDYPSANIYFEFAAKTYEEVEVFAEAAECYKKMASMYLEKLENSLLASVFYTKAAELYVKAGKYDEGIKSYITSAELSSSVGDMNAASSNYMNVAELIRKNGKHEEAAKYYIKAAGLVERTERYSEMVKTYLGIAQNYAETKDFENAAYYYLMAAETSKDSDEVSTILGYTNTARCYQQLQKFDEAVRYYLKAAETSVKAGKPLDAARSYWSIAGCHKDVGDVEKAADFYIKFAEYAKLAEKGADYAEGYRIAAEIYQGIAEEHSKGERLDESMEFYLKAARCFAELNDNAQAGDLYLKVGLLKKKNNMPDYTDILSKAAEYYVLANDLFHASECYLELEDYMKAAKSFSEYADNQLAKSNFFSAGEGYLKAGTCYEENHQRELMTDRLNKAAKAYLKYIDKVSKLGLAEEEGASLGDAYLGIAESHRMMGDFLKARKYFESAQNSFEEQESGIKAVLAKAFLSKVSARLSIQKGDYPLAADLLSSALDSFEQAISQGEWDEKYRAFLLLHEGESRKMLTDMGEKPEIELSMDKSALAFVGTDIAVNFVIVNKGNRDIKKVTFISHLPDNVVLSKQPATVDELLSGESVNGSFLLKIMEAGAYRVKPLEALYEDSLGDKYMKSSDIVSLEVFEKPQPSFRDYMGAIEVYEKYAKSQFKNKNFFYAAEGYKSAAECFKEYGLKRAADSSKLKKYYEKSLKAYLSYLESLRQAKQGNKTFRQIADTDFNIADCYENMDDFENAKKYLEESSKNYAQAIEGATDEKEKSLLTSQMGVINAFLARVRAKEAIKSDDYAAAKSLLRESLDSFEEALSVGWSAEYVEFLKKRQKEARDLLGSIKNKETRSNAKAVEKQESKGASSAEEKKTAWVDHQIERMLVEKKEIERKIENAKKRYYNRQLDEKMLREIVEGYQKQLIEVDVNLESLKKRKSSS